MNIIVVVDNYNGMMFNHRRLSRDSALTAKILEISQYTKLRISPFSEDLFTQLPDNLEMSDNFLDEAVPGDICLDENELLMPYAKQIDTFYLFKWNRNYPSDMKLDFIPSEQGMSLRKTEDFVGSSHDDITLEIWQKE